MLKHRATEDHLQSRRYCKLLQHHSGAHSCVHLPCLKTLLAGVSDDSLDLPCGAQSDQLNTSRPRCGSTGRPTESPPPPKPRALDRSFGTEPSPGDPARKNRVQHSLSRSVRKAPVVTTSLVVHHCRNSHCFWLVRISLLSNKCGQGLGLHFMSATGW